MYGYYQDEKIVTIELNMEAPFDETVREEMKQYQAGGTDVCIHSVTLTLE